MGLADAAGRRALTALGDAHAVVGSAVIVLAAALALAAAAMAWLKRSPRWLEVARLGLTGLLGAQLAVGAVLYVVGRRPAEALHLLYAVAALGLLPLAASFAAEAPPRSRAAVLAVAGVLVAFLGWRLAATG